MMKLMSVLLAAAVGLACTAPAAAEMRISSSGVGDAVYVPYYSVDDGFSSLFTVGNDGDEPSMVRLVFSEALNGQNVLYFNLFLPPRAVWSATLSRQPDGRALLQTESGICTLTSFGNRGVSLLPFDYANNHPDGGPTGIERTHSGAFEVIELATLVGDFAAFTNSRNCAALQAAYVEPIPDHSPMLRAPASQISANAHLIAVAEGIVYSVPGIPLIGISQAARDPDYSGTPRIFTPQLADGETEFVVRTAHDTLRFGGSRGADAVSSLFMLSRLTGEFYALPAIGATTRWVVSFPTKSAYVSNRPGSIASNGVAVPPFSTFFDAEGSCDAIEVRDRRLDGTPREVVGAISVDLCAQVNLIDFTGAFAESGRRDLLFHAPTGRDIVARSLQDTPLVLTGLPVVGLSISNFVNSQLQGGVLANYSFSQSLRSAASQAVAPTN